MTVGCRFTIGIVLALSALGATASTPPTSMPASTGHLTAKDCHTTPLTFGGPWMLRYSFAGSIIPSEGELHLVLRSNGGATVTTQLYQKPKHTKTIKIPKSAMQKLIAVLSKWPTSCIRTHVRQGYFMADAGRTSITVIRHGLASTSVIDSCHYVDNVDGFQAIYDALGRLEPYLGSAITWSPGAYTSVKSDACSSTHAAPNTSSKRTR